MLFQENVQIACECLLASIILLEAREALSLIGKGQGHWKLRAKKLLKHQIRCWLNIQNKDIIEEHKMEPYTTPPAPWSPGWHGHQWCLHTALHVLTQARVTVTSSGLIHGTRLCPHHWQHQGKNGSWRTLTFFPTCLKSLSLEARCTNSLHTDFSFLWTFITERFLKTRNLSLTY